MINIGDFMNYLLILFLKILENTLATLRLILVSNGKKWLGAILLFITSIIWIISSHIAIIDLNITMVLIFSLGSLIGSYIGSVLEEKLAFGNNVIFCISEKRITIDLRNLGYIVTEMEGNGIESKKFILMVVLKRKQNKEFIQNINSLDSNAIIISGNTNILYTK